MKIASRLMMVVLVAMLASWSLSTGCSKDGGDAVVPDLGDVTDPGEDIEPPDIITLPPDITTPPPDITIPGGYPTALFQGQFVKKLTGGTGAEAGALFGSSVSISGDRLMVGQPRKDSGDGDANAGATYIYKKSGNDWTEDWSKVFNSASLEDIYYGYSVSISGDDAIVGIPHGVMPFVLMPDVGAVILYKHDGTSWGHLHPGWASDYYTGDEFGASVAMDGDYAIVGAPYKDNGAAYIFKLDGGSWTEYKKIEPPMSSSREFGFSVAIHGDSAIVGAPQYSTGGMGKARIYIRNSSDVWNIGVSFLPAGISSDARFGYSVAIGEKYAVVGAPYDDEKGFNAGVVYVYKRDGATWTEDIVLYSGKPQSSAYFGWSVAVSGDYIVVGAPNEEIDTMNNAGAAYVSRHDGNVWTEPIRIDAGAAGDLEIFELFGKSVAIDGSTVVVGAPNKNEGSDITAGAVYIFK